MRVIRESAAVRITLVDESGELSATLAHGRWAIANAPTDRVQIAVAGGWSNPNTLRFDVAFIDTPHRLQPTMARTAS